MLLLLEHQSQRMRTICTVRAIVTPGNRLTLPAAVRVIVLPRRSVQFPLTHLSTVRLSIQRALKFRVHRTAAFPGVSIFSFLLP